MADSTEQGTDDKVVAGPAKLAGSNPTAVEGRAPARTTADERVATQPREEKGGVEKQASEGKGDKSCSKLPDERRLWKFLEGVKGWRFTGSGWTVCGPEGGGGGDSGSSMEAAELPQYVVSHPSLLAEYKEWQQRQADGHEQEKPQESTRPEEKRQDKGAAAVVEKGNQTLPSEDREQAQEAGAPPTPADKPCSVVDKSRTVKGSTVIGISPEATAAEKPAGVVDPAHTTKGSTQTSSSQGNASPEAPAAGEKPATAADVARTVEGSTETSSQGCVSPAEKPARSCAAELSPAAAGAATAAAAAALAAAPATAAAAAAAQRGASTTATVTQCSSPPKPSGSVPQGDIKGSEEGYMVGPDNIKETPHQGAAMEVEVEAGVEEVEVTVEGKGEAQEAPYVNMEVDGEAGLKAAQGEKAVGGDVGQRGGASEKRSGDAVGPAGAGAAAAPGDVAGAGGGGAGAAPKGKAKGDGKEGTAFGPCMCPQGSDGVHKTVDVERRCWPGSNKPGGIGRITKKYTVEEEVCGEMVQMSYFDIKYLLGGSEKKVQETYISCTPLEIAARQSTPRDRFTVEVPEPTTRRQKPARTPPPPAPTRMSPLASSLDANTSLSPPKAKAKGSRSLKKVSPAVKRSKPMPAAAAAVAGGREGKGPRKRARTADGGERACKKASSQSECKENQEVHREREVPARSEEPTRHAITDLSVVVEATKTPSAPLSAGRMDAFQLALGALFRQSATDTISLAKVHADINAQVVHGTSPFNDNEVTLSLKYLEDVESKVMLDSGMLYRI
ncbi:unnamed protein product [Ectocarpus sp. CCAP 1310/34]|nr:unnamed protein product [Ectocarpus sp. CCAP 1310/34]